MTRTPAALSAILFAAVLAISAPLSAETPKAQNLTAAFRAEGSLLYRLQVFEVGGVVVIRGRARSESEKEAVSEIATRLGYSRVANLVTITAAPDDAAIERLAERELALHRGLDGCTFSVNSHDGIVRVAGRVHRELQKDMALAVLRNIDGVRAVETSLVLD